ncbi:carbon-nitrogen hydrolase [Corynespora cassiicola Philippines]|uniref:nitrilase n=1 Tax=Corynespora cassiicola Philippines TaxID=1448308 RepID=A0A2T2NRQ1_CORCC|nr:carbon-nitrogen hydrolase [Corynespora cassiicola Philippines]
MVKVAVTQHEPVWLDLDASVDKACRLIEEAASNGAKLVAFPEVWIPGYPFWIWARPVDPPTTTHYIKNSLRYDSPQIARLQTAARQSNIAVVLGFSENDGKNSLYIAQCIISAKGELLMRRRKLKPTHMERTVFGDAGGDSLDNVVDVEGVGKVGALACWEHIQPLLKYHTAGLGEEVHVAAWPPVPAFEEGGQELFSMSAEGIQLLSQAHAIEAGTFVLHCTAVITQKGLDAMKLSIDDTPLVKDTPGGGFSAVFAPDGRRLTQPIPPSEEGFVYADLPMDFCTTIRSFVDAHGHYSRPELLWLGVDKRKKECVRVESDDRDGEKGSGKG